MLAEIAQFNKWLRRKNPHSSAPIHYTNDLTLFFNQVHKSPAETTVVDVDKYIDRCQQAGHATATINRRLAALRSFYAFLDLTTDNAPPNPVLPKCHFIRQGQRLPRDLADADPEQFFAVVDSVRDRAIFVLMFWFR